MAGAMRKMAVYLGLVENEDRYDEYDSYDRQQDQREYDERTRQLHAVRDDDPAPSRQVTSAPAPTRSTVAPGASASRITTLHPRTYNDARAIGEQFRDGIPVIMNLSEMDDGDAKRIVDFAAGLSFGLHGTIERVTQKVFLLSPADVVVTAEEKAQMAQGGFFNQS
ncbi:MAG: cell division protein SepF [Actinomycetia bacterium]|nr:cell division protein SepF [Actinomycetes bacterium]